MKCSRVDAYLNYCILCILHGFCNSARIKRAYCHTLSLPLTSTGPLPPLCSDYRVRALQLYYLFLHPAPFFYPLPAYLYFLSFSFATSTVSTICLLSCLLEQAALCFPPACPSNSASELLLNLTQMSNLLTPCALTYPFCVSAGICLPALS
jgi:hypothetical protein